MQTTNKLDVTVVVDFIGWLRSGSTGPNWRNVRLEIIREGSSILMFALLFQRNAFAAKVGLDFAAVEIRVERFLFTMAHK